MGKDNNNRDRLNNDIQVVNEVIYNIRNINEMSIKETGKEKYALVKTWGCQMNEHDSEKIAGMLGKMGYVLTNDKEKADIIIFNTCCVRENAELKVYGNIGSLKPLKQKNPQLIIGICGCMIQQKDIAEQIARKYPFVDLLFGTHNTHLFPCMLQKAMKENRIQVDIWEKENSVVEGIPVERGDGLKAWVTIMYGCDNYCSYCIVPFVRGRERSRSPESVVKEIAALSQQGYKEVTLLGQNVNSYGKDLDNNINFSYLLNEVNKINGIERIRFMTSHPKDLSEELVHTIRDCEKVCEQLHLPIQSGSNRILEIMNRKYTKEQYLTLVRMIKDKVPGIVLSTDIIIGFPGETEEDFNHTVDVIKAVKFDSAFTFIYSKRTGTPAAEMEEQVEEEVKNRRISEIIDLQNRISREMNKTILGHVVEVLVEGPGKKEDGKLTGRTRGGKIVNFIGNKELNGRLVYVKINEVSPFWLNGELYL